MTQRTSATRAQIDRVNAAFLKAFQQGDGAGIAATYAEDGQILPPNMEIMGGREAIQAFWLGVHEMGITDGSLETVELSENGDSAWEVGKYTLKSADGTLIDVGKYIVVWKQTNGVWQWHRDIWNSSRPAA